MIATFFFAGVGSATFGLAGVFFLKFWRVSRDRFFLFLCWSCLLLALERLAAMLIFVSFPQEIALSGLTRSWIYVLRLVAFTMILVSIAEKNRQYHRKG
jgi:hypothetical protein